MFKRDLMTKAGKHTVHMAYAYREEIEKSIENSTIYDENTQFKGGFYSADCGIYLMDTDTVSAAQQYANSGKVALLNFASYKNPGGQFLNGLYAQEEALCHAGFLYNVLSEFNEYYEWNNKHKNNSLYMNRAIYSPDITFNPETRNEFTCDVITCAAPNLNPYYRYGNGDTTTLQENAKVLDSRMAFLMKIAVENRVDTLILGAWGCGVFKQNPTEVAKFFMKNIFNYGSDIQNFIFAIPDKNSANYIAFKEVLKDY